MKRPKTILYIQHPFVLGGSCVSLLYLLQQLDCNEYEPVVACLYDAPEVVQLYRSHGIRTLVIGGETFSHTTGGWWPLTNPVGIRALLRWMLQLPRTVSRLRKILAEVGPDLVHFNSLTLAPYAPFVRRTGVPTILHVRESVHPGHFGVRRSILHYLASTWCDRVVYICHHDRDLLGGNAGEEVVYNSVDLDRFDRTMSQAAARERLALGVADKVVLYLGGISEIKGVIPLLGALPKVKARVPSLVCLMPGATSAKQDRAASFLRRVASRLGWRSRTEERAANVIASTTDLHAYARFLPFSGDVPSLIAASDVVVFPSTEPHFPRPVMEAAVMGKPVVASNIGGVNEIVKHGVTGLLVEPGNADLLADALINLLSDGTGKAEQMGEEAYRRARETFDARVNSGRIFSIYRQLIESGGRSRPHD